MAFRVQGFGVQGSRVQGVGLRGGDFQGFREFQEFDRGLRDAGIPVRHVMLWALLSSSFIGFCSRLSEIHVPQGHPGICFEVLTAMPPASTGLNQGPSDQGPPVFSDALEGHALRAERSRSHSSWQ